MASFNFAYRENCSLGFTKTLKTPIYKTQLPSRHLHVQLTIETLKQGVKYVQS